MKSLNKHIILIGFKNVGKTAIGKNLANTLNKPFIDLDAQIELLHEQQSGKKLTCRHIMEKSGEVIFRLLETSALQKVLRSREPAVISLGGGTATLSENQLLIKDHTVIHVTAPRGIIFERIMMGGRPAFFDINEDLLDSFNKLFNQREKIYETLHDIAILNNGSIDMAVNHIVERLS
ncbi:MAG TPA: shikimate kinase [Gammaproteobacteria bacterium]|nr:shikimate kinase [Gammaproteobacteria bacterium]